MSAAFGLTSQIHSNHVKSAFLLAGFPLLLVLMMAAFFFFTSAAAMTPPGAAIDWGGAQQAAVDGVLQYGPFAVGAAGIWFVIAYFFHGGMMRAATGAKPVTRAEYPKIYNMLENLCISRGMPMPAFEIIDSPALNAFASGVDQKSFKIVLTRGIIDALADDELEAVIGHELTHIRNRDVRLLIISVIFVGIISFLAEMTFRMLVHGGRSRGGNKRNNGFVMLIALAILAVGYVLAIVIRFALSRKREYLADAGSIELTKNPEAMMRALMRISGNDRVPGMADEVQQMCIENSASFMGIFATHPPIAKRIEAISIMTNTPVPQLQPKQQGPWG